MESQYTDLNAQYATKAETYYELSRPEMVEFIPESAKKVLEVGCSGGGFGALLKKERPDVEVWGIEPSEDVAGKASEKLDKVICGTFQAGLAELQGQKFDCIVFNDVLEHLVNPEIALKDSKQYLSENGTVVASIPNILHFYQIWAILKDQDWKYEESGILDNTHLRFFTKKSILRLFENCGYEVTRLDGINPSYGHTFSIFRLFTLGHISDWKYVQFAIQAKSVIAI